MIVVADTSPINYLILIDQISVLETLYRRVLIPHAVHDELLNPHAPASVRAWAKNPPEWLEMLSPSKPLSLFGAKLGPGESEAIALAEELGAERLLIDERAGWAITTSRGLQTIGTLGILREAHRAGLLDLRLSLDQLQASGFRVSRNLIELLLNSI
jgi:predicted nucleic acid-binding protein